MTRQSCHDGLTPYPVPPRTPELTTAVGSVSVVPGGAFPESLMTSNGSFGSKQGVGAAGLMPE